MYTVEFYEDKNGNSQIFEFIEELRVKSISNKDARIQYKQMSMYFELLSLNGTNMNDNITKHIEDGIWELRPGVNRIFYFFYNNDTYVLLHQFRKRTQKTPKSEIEKAKREREDYFKRKGLSNNENMG